MQHIALEGRGFVLSACQYLTRGNCPDDYNAIQGDDPNTFSCEAAVASFHHSVNYWLAQIIMAQLILTTDLDYGDITRGKFDFDVSGHYARPDVFRLRVNKRKMKPI